MSRSLLHGLMASGWAAHLLAIAGFLFAFLLVARLLSEKRQPSNTLAWLLAVTLVPYVGVPLYLIFGGRKLRRLVKRKRTICPLVPAALHSQDAGHATARALVLNGVCPPVGGNSIHFLSTGEQTYTELEKQILQAKESICIMTFILGRDEVGRRIIQLLAQRAREGVKVRLLLDAVGCFFSSGRFCKPLREAGGEVAKFMPVLPLQPRFSANLRNHRKIAIFDKSRAIVGGHNLAKEYIGPRPFKKRWRDFGAVISGPAVMLLTEIFLADWTYASRVPLDQVENELVPQPPISGTSEVQVAASGPDVEGDPLYEGIISLIQEAEHSIWVITPYFIPDEVLYRSLMVKARTGKDVKLIIPARSNHPITDLARCRYLRDLHLAGVEILLFQDGMMHSKGIIVDGKIGLIGSANFDMRSLFVNFEVGIFLYTRDDVVSMIDWAHGLMKNCTPYPTGQKQPGWLITTAEDLSRLIAPLL